jgi:hypothetical protein
MHYLCTVFKWLIYRIMDRMIDEILSTAGTKTAKIQRLLALGLTRKRVAELVTNGNYGFVQNVYAKMMLDRIFACTPFNRRFGIEFEAFNVPQQKLLNALIAEGINCEIEGYGHTTRTHWKIVNDSSIHANSTFELVSPVLEGTDGIEEVRTVCKVLRQCNAKVNKTCGTHIHLDAAGFNLKTWKNIYKNYARLENVIDAFMPVSRRANNCFYCKSLKLIANFEQEIDNANSLSEIEWFLYSRYFKINPLSYSRHKTIEFRQHNGTIEFDKVSNWIYFLHNLVCKSAQGLIENSTIEGLADFNQNEIVEFYKQRTLKLMR